MGADVSSGRGEPASLLVLMLSSGSDVPGEFSHRVRDPRDVGDWARAASWLQLRNDPAGIPGVGERTGVLGLEDRSRTAMTGDDAGSVTCWLGNLRGGDLAAAQPLWERYFSRLVVVARGKLKKLRRSTADEDEE